MAPEVSFFLSAEFVTTFAATCRKVLHPSGLGQVDQRTDLASGVLPASDFADKYPPHTELLDLQPLPLTACAAQMLRSCMRHRA